MASCHPEIFARKLSICNNLISPKPESVVEVIEKLRSDYKSALERLETATADEVTDPEAKEPSDVGYDFQSVFLSPVNGNGNQQQAGGLKPVTGNANNIVGGCSGLLRPGPGQQAGSGGGSAAAVSMNTGGFVPTAPSGFANTIHVRWKSEERYQK